MLTTTLLEQTVIIPGRPGYGFGRGPAGKIPGVPLRNGTGPLAQLGLCTNQPDEDEEVRKRVIIIMKGTTPIDDDSIPNDIDFDVDADGDFDGDLDDVQYVVKRV